jgi:serine/threonine protein kinase
MKKKKIDNYVLNLEEVLGEGSFGMVHKGINEVDQSPVAIKVLSKKLSNAIYNVVDED